MAVNFIKSRIQVNFMYLVVMKFPKIGDLGPLMITDDPWDPRLDPTRRWVPRFLMEVSYASHHGVPQVYNGKYHERFTKVDDENRG